MHQHTQGDLSYQPIKVNALLLVCLAGFTPLRKFVAQKLLALALHQHMRVPTVQANPNLLTCNITFVPPPIGPSKGYTSMSGNAAPAVVAVYGP